jgi:hypothetical protein
MSTERDSMHPADKAVLRLAAGLGLAVLAAYGLALPLPYALCVMAVLVLCKPGRPIPLLKGAVLAALVALLVAAGGLLVPLLENYAWAGVLLTGTLLYGVFARGGGAARTTILAMTVCLTPVAGVAEQALAPLLGLTLGLGIATGVLASNVAHVFFPDAPSAPARPPAAPAREAANWIAIRATIVVMPVFVLALTNPSFYLAAILKAVALGQQAGSTSARAGGRELVGATLMGAAMAAVLWMGLSLRPRLWMLVLWMAGAALWAGARMFRARPSAMPPSFWRNALVTMLILLGPAIEDNDAGKDVFTASLMRVALFVGVALYAWAAVWVLERWRGARAAALPVEMG